MCHWIAALHYPDLHALTLVSRGLHQQVERPYVWYIAYRSTFTATRLNFTSLAPTAWKPLFLEQVQLRYDWCAYKDKVTYSWRTLFDLDTVAPVLDNVTVQGELEIVQDDEEDRRLVVILLTDSEDIVEATTRVVVMVDVYSAAMVRFIKLPPFEEPTYVLGLVDLPSRVIVGFVYEPPLDGETNEMCVALWMYRWGQEGVPAEAYSVTLEVVTGEVRGIKFVEASRHGDTFYLRGLDKVSLRVVTLTFKFARLEEDGLFPRFMSMSYMGSEPAFHVYSNNDIPELAIVVRTADAYEAEVWSHRYPHVLARLGGLEQFDANARTELWGMVAFDVASAHATLVETLNARPLRFVASTGATILVWELDNYHSMCKNCPIIAPTVMYSAMNHLDNEIMAMYHGIALFTNYDRTMFLDLAGAGQVITRQDGQKQILPHWESTVHTEGTFTLPDTDIEITESPGTRRLPYILGEYDDSECTTYSVHGDCIYWLDSDYVYEVNMSST